jgi:catechol 2,3-dioxygenase-like lactoylglutathione lyase family enzyme
VLRFEHVGVVVEDLDAVTAFFVDLGFELEGRTTVEGEVPDRINGLDGVRAEIVMVRTPDGTGRLELVKYLAPVDDASAEPLPPNRAGYWHITLEVDDVNGKVDRLREQGFHPVGEVQDYEDIYRLVYIRGPEGLIVELAQKL